MKHPSMLIQYPEECVGAATASEGVSVIFGVTGGRKPGDKSVF